jgi:hypothetical protein
VLIAVGVLGLLPWPGARAILRRAERDPDVLVTDPDRRRARGRRAMMILVPAETLFVFAVGYLVDGWPAAIFMGPLGAAGALLGAWFYTRWAKT